MNTTWKIVIAVVVVLAIAGGVFASVKYSQRGIVTVQTGKVIREDLASVVTASGEIKPRTYINIGAEYQGQITEILVKEGARVQKGQLLARIDEAQSAADVAAQKAAVTAAEADAAASEASLKAGEDNVSALEATLARTKADLERYRTEYDRGQQLFKQGLIPKQDFDQRKALFDSQTASVNEAQSRIVQGKAQLAQLRAQIAGSQRRVTQAQAGLARVSDILRKHNVIAPLNGLVTYLPVRVGETVVPGVQNSAASTIMTIADMSIVTSEVKVDESDIVNVKLGQEAEVAIDAIPGKKFAGHVIEIGNTAILRSTGLAASQSNTSSQEAKDFKVVVGIDNPPDEIRPGLSSTSKITTSTRKGVLGLPIQALTTRTKGNLEDAAKTLANKGKPPAYDPNAKVDPVKAKERKEEVQGVFVIGADGRAIFTKVETGISGAQDIEVVSGLKEGDQYISGPYQVIRTIKDRTMTKIDNKPPAPKPTT